MSANIEIEKKYIILKPSEDDMSLMDGFDYSDIIQIYLPAENGQTHRIRKRKYSDGREEYTETVKRRIDRMSSFEDETEIDRERFDFLSTSILRGTIPVIKRRYTFTYISQLFEVDVYPQYGHTAIMETELDSEDREVVFPDFLKILLDVTGDKKYSNASMSREFPPELLVE